MMGEYSGNIVPHDRYETTPNGVTNITKKSVEAYLGAAKARNDITRIYGDIQLVHTLIGILYTISTRKRNDSAQTITAKRIETQHVCVHIWHTSRTIVLLFI